MVAMRRQGDKAGREKRRACLMESDVTEVCRRRSGLMDEMAGVGVDYDVERSIIGDTVDGLEVWIIELAEE